MSIKPWNRQPGESKLAFQRFQSYLSQAPPRSRKKLADETGAHLKALDSMANRHEWTDRIQAWDDELTRRADNAVLGKAEEMQERHLQALRGTFARGVQLIREGEGDARAGAKMISEAIRLERLIVGEATERTEARLEVSRGAIDLTQLSEEEQSELAGLLGTATMQRAAMLLAKARKA